MALNPGIILSGQQPNFLATIDQANRAAAFQGDVMRQNALARLYQDQGAGIMAGEQESLNALAGFDPAAALGIKSQQEQLAMARAAAARAAESHARSAGLEQLAAEAEKLDRALRGASYFYANGDQEGYNQFLAQNGVDPNEYRFEQFPAIAAAGEGILETYAGFLAQNAPPKPEYETFDNQLVQLNAPNGPAVVPIEGFQPRAADEPGEIAALRIRAAEAGLVPGTPEYQNFMLNKGSAPRGTQFRVTPEGVVEFNEGVGVGSAGGAFTEGQSKDIVYATRAEGALEKLEPVADSLASWPQRAAGADPTGVLRGAIQTDEFQQAQQAGNEFLQAVLRKDTGAAITPQEMIDYGQTYLPQPGDGEAVLAQKAAARRRAVEAMKAGMPPAAILAQERALGAGSAAAPAAGALSPAAQEAWRLYGGQ